MHISLQLIYGSHLKETQDTAYGFEVGVAKAKQDLQSSRFRIRTKEISNKQKNPNGHSYRMSSLPGIFTQKAAIICQDLRGSYLWKGQGIGL